MNISLRAETEVDIPFLRTLYISMRWDELAILIDWSDEQKVAFLESQFDYQRRHYRNAYWDAEFNVVQLDGQDVGRLYLHRGIKDLRIVDVGVLPAFRNQGVGTQLLKGVLAEGDATDKTVSIHVEVFNPAQHLYRRLGFRDVHQDGPYIYMIRNLRGQEE